MADLRPAARAVLGAMHRCYSPEPTCRLLAADILRAVADQAKRGPEHWEGLSPDDFDKGWDQAVNHILAIAAELEGLYELEGGHD